jgi:myo-inositol-1(or 4)-monophosphatase
MLICFLFLLKIDKTFPQLYKSFKMNLQNITAQANSLIIQVGDFILDERKNFTQDKVNDKGLNQLVSYVDIEAEKKLVEGLKLILPEASYITEEDTITQIQTEYQWIIDPLDGTTNFIHNLPIFSISVALAKGNEILIGIVYELGKKDLFAAWHGGGAWCNGEPIKVSDCNVLSKSLLATGFPYTNFEQTENYLNVLKQLMKSSHGLRRMGSAAVDLAYVACGKFEGFFEYGLSPWDVAAGCLLVTEAGGNIYDFKGGEDYIFGKTIVSGNIPIAKALLEEIQKEF